MSEAIREIIDVIYEIFIILIAFAGWGFAMYKDKMIHKINNKARAYEHILKIVYILERVAALGELTRAEYEAKNAEILSVDLYGSDKVIGNLNQILDTIMKINNNYKGNLSTGELEQVFFEELNILSKSMREDLGYKSMKNDPTTLSDIEFIE